MCVNKSIKPHLSIQRYKSATHLPTRWPLGNRPSPHLSEMFGEYLIQFCGFQILCFDNLDLRMTLLTLIVWFRSLSMATRLLYYLNLIAYNWWTNFTHVTHFTDFSTFHRFPTTKCLLTWMNNWMYQSFCQWRLSPEAICCFLQELENLYWS